MDFTNFLDHYVLESTNFTAIEASGVDPSGESVEHDPCSTGLLVHNLYDSPLSSSLVFLDGRRPETETLSTLRVILQQLSFRHGYLLNFLNKEKFFS